MNERTKKLIDKHLEKARTKHPDFVAEGVIQIPSIATEELGEMCKEINEVYNSETVDDCVKHKKLAIEEALDLIAVLIRFIEGDK